MKKFSGHHFIFPLALALFVGNRATGQEQMAGIPWKYEELNVIQFKEALTASQTTCIIPIGVLEKHGPHLPLGTDLINVRELALRAAMQEYTIIFPAYYFSQIFEAKHQPGTIAYSHETIWTILQETCDELSRNGIKKIIIVNGHGGNNSFLPYFCQAQLSARRDYVVYLFTPLEDAELEKQLAKLRKTDFDFHGGEIESSRMMSHRPDLVKTSRARDQSGIDQDRLENLKQVYTGIWWYASFPNHYAGDGSYANKEIGELAFNNSVSKLVEMIQVVKADDSASELQNRFFNESENPLKTKQ